MSASRFARFAWALLVYTVLVILWGAFVRATGSGAGCGSHWPMCNGAPLPRDPTAETLIEWTHRVTSGLAWVGALVLAWAARRAFARGHRVRTAAAVVLLLMTTEALIGAGLVLFEMVADNASLARGGWMATHLVNTFLLLMASTLTAWWASGGAPLRWRGHGALGAILAAALGGVLLLGVSGAIAALGDTLFPSGSLEEALERETSTSAHLFVRLRVLHPLIGLVVGAVVLFAAGMAATSRPTRAVRRTSAVVALTYVAQVGLGFLNVALLAPVWMQLVHLLVADVFWVALVVMAAATLSAPAAEPTVAGDVQGAPPGA